MTKQHRATPEQWVQQALWVETYEDSSCIMELLHRIEALESTQHAHVDTSHLTDAERKQIREDLSCPAAWQPLKIATETTYGTAPIVAPTVKESLTDPAGSLLDRVADAIGAVDDEGLTNMTWSNHSRAAILEVAAWLRDDAPQSCPLTARWLEQEANQ
jgi:hypothetical protein